MLPLGADGFGKVAVAFGAAVTSARVRLGVTVGVDGVKVGETVEVEVFVMVGVFVGVKGAVTMAIAV